MAPRPSAVARFVDQGLEERANDATKRWWTDYLKGEAEFRGVKMADIRAVARAANDRFDLDRYEVADLLAETDHLFAQSETEDKLCATLLLAEHHLDRLGTDDVERLAVPRERDELADSDRYPAIQIGVGRMPRLGGSPRRLPLDIAPPSPRARAIQRRLPARERRPADHPGPRP